MSFLICSLLVIIPPQSRSLETAIFPVLGLGGEFHRQGDVDDEMEWVCLFFLFIFIYFYLFLFYVKGYKRVSKDVWV
jgi:hypothetical protein